jgi:hypothetical protein
MFPDVYEFLKGLEAQFEEFIHEIEAAQKKFAHHFEPHH